MSEEQRARKTPGRDKEARERLDVLLVERGLAPSRERARALIMAREVRVDGRMVDKPGTLVSRASQCALVGPAAELRYVSRGGLKLERALDTFDLDPAGRVCLDVGASTGGFTDLLLRRGAVRVYAIDVGRGQLAWVLRQDPRVVVMDRTNIRHLASLPELGHCAVIDVSFISLRLVLPHVAALVREGAWIVALVKPQFEAGRAEADRSGGVITNSAVHRRVLDDLLGWLAAHSPVAVGAPNAESSVDVAALIPRGLVASPITGRDGNHEYLLWLEKGTPDASAAERLREEVPRVVDAAFAPRDV